MKPLIVANWKLNPTTIKKAKWLFNSVKNEVKNIKKIETVICPPFIYLPELKPKGVKLGAQNCFWEKEGAFTGEISADMLKSLDCKYIILGHSERRQYFKETDLMVNKKIKAVLKLKLKLIFCIGETGQEKNKGKTQKIIKSQIEKGLKGVSKEEVKNISIAYEPIWAIGTGKACQPLQTKVINLVIRKVISKLYSRKLAEEIQILYGGSVKRENALSYLKESGMKGLLIGGASLKPKEFIGIIKDANSL